MPVVKKERGGKRSGPADASPATNSRSHSPISLPEKANVPPTSLTDYILFIYGEKGIGKTSLLAQFPNSLIFMFEPFRRNLAIKQIPNFTCKEPPITWDRFLAYADKLVNLPAAKRPTIITIDTIDRAYDLLCANLCDEFGYADVRGLKWGDWDVVDSRLEQVFSLFKDAGIGIAVTSHSKKRELEVETESGDMSYTMTAPTVKPRCWKFLKMIGDFSIYYGYNGRQRTLTIRGHERLWTSCARSDKFLDPSGNPLYEIPAGNSPQEAYKNLMLAWQGRLAGIDRESTEEDTK